MGIFSAAELVAAGSLAGFLAGFFGVEEGLLLVPALLYFYHADGISSLVSTHMAIGTSLLVALCAAVIPMFGVFTKKQVIWRAVGFAGVGYVAGALAGGIVATSVQGDILRKLFACIMFLAAVRLVSSLRKAKGEPDPTLPGPGLVGIGVLSGALSSLTGINGSGFSFPFMYRALHVPQKKAAGTSRVIAVVGLVIASAIFVKCGWGNEFAPPSSLGFVDWLRAIPLVVGVIPASFAGTVVAELGTRKNLRRAFAIVLLVIMIRLLFL